MGYAPKNAAQEDINWDIEQAVKETDLQLLMTETTNDPTLLEALVCLEHQQHELIPNENQPHKKKVPNRFGLVFIEDQIIVAKNP